MFQRNHLKELESWYNSKRRKPLILRGARQVGKSSLIHLFANKFKLNLVEINFETSILESLDNKVIDLGMVIHDIELSMGRKLIPEMDLIFFDEIQKCPNALLALRYFYEKKPELSIVAAGSLLDVLLPNTDISFPVGRIEFLPIGPVTFSEFLLATRQEFLYEEWKKDLNSISLKAHHLLIDQYRIFCCVGGLPEAVDVYRETKDLFAVRKIHKSIIQTFKADFLKYANKHDIFRCDKILDYVPSHLGQKVKYTEIDSNEKARDLNKALQTLLYARVILAAYHSNAKAIPLRATMDEKLFKLFYLDVGLALTQTQEEFKNIMHGESSLSGPTAEQFIGQHLSQLNSDEEPNLFYWLRDKSSAKAEIDFMYSLGNKIIPIEVKANKSIHFKSMNVVMAENPKMKLGIIFSGQPYKQQTIRANVIANKKTFNVDYTLVNLPLWSIEKINEEILKFQNP